MQTQDHWAVSLKSEDKCLATIRHKTDGSKYTINAEVTVIENFPSASKVVVFYKGETVPVPYNELKQIPA